MRGALLLVASLVLAGRAVAQQSACPRPASKAELVAALEALRGGGDPEVAAARLAMQGQPVVLWALELAADSSGATPAGTRAAALLVMRYARWRRAVPVLVQVAQPLRGDWIVWSGALAALAAWPFEELEPFWLDLIEFPRRVVREQALRGLAMAGTSHDMLNVREATQKDPEMRPLVAEVEAKLALPVAARDTVTFGWPPDSTGRFVPSARWLAVHGSCPK
jgi:HEAT repeat protein